MKVAEAVARSLVDEGVEAVFSLLGDVNMDIVYRLSELGVPVYEGRHEASVFAMADGYSRATGKVAVCGVTSGPAVAHALTPLTSAARTRSSVLLVTGARSLDDVHERQNFDHEGLVRLAGAHYRAVYSADAAVDAVRSVVDLTRSTGKPVVFDVATDVQTLEYEWDLQRREPPPWLRPQRLQPDPAVLEAAMAIVAQAERPVLLAGGGANESGARDELFAFGRELGALLATTINVRGFFHGDPFDAGVAGLYSSHAATELFGQADCVVAFGASLNRYTTESGYLFPAARVVQVDVESPKPMQSGDAADCYVQGDALAVAQAMRKALASQPGRERFRTRDVAERLAGAADDWTVELDPGEVDPRALCARLDELLPEECGFVSGNSGHFWAFPIMHMPRWRQPMLFATYFGAIGYGLPVGVGAALADPQRPIVAFEGDASAMMYPHVLETAARYGARLLAVVLNDRALGAEYHKMVSKGYEPELSLTPTVNPGGVAQAMGARSVTLTDLDQLPGIVSDFLEGSGPLLVDARVSRSVISQPFRRMWYGMDE